MVVPTGQGTPNTPYQGVTVSHFNPEGVHIQAVPCGGRCGPYTSATGDDCRMTPIKGVYFSGSTGTMYGAG